MSATLNPLAWLSRWLDRRIDARIAAHHRSMWADTIGSLGSLRASLRRTQVEHEQGLQLSRSFKQDIKGTGPVLLSRRGKLIGFLQGLKVSANG